MAGNIIQGGFFDTLHVIEEHLHSKTMAFPTGAATIRLSTIASAWPSYTSVVIKEIVSAAGAPSSTFDIHWAVVSNISLVADYELLIFSGEAGVEELIAVVPFARDTFAASIGGLPVVTPRQAKNTRISASIRHSAASIDTVQVKLAGHIY